MSISDQDVLTVAKLSRLSVEDESVSDVAKQLSSILDMVDQLNQVNTDGIEPLSNPLEATQRLRPDEVTETNQREQFQAIAPSVAEGLYLVPKVIE